MGRCEVEVDIQSIPLLLACIAKVPTYGSLSVSLVPNLSTAVHVLGHFRASSSSLTMLKNAARRLAPMPDEPLALGCSSMYGSDWSLSIDDLGLGSDSVSSAEDGCRG